MDTNILLHSSMITPTVYYIKQKSEVFEIFKEFKASASNECGRNTGALRTDNGGEYVSREFDAYLKSKGIRHELTIAHTPEQNGVAERMTIGVSWSHAVSCRTA